MEYHSRNHRWAIVQDNADAIFGVGRTPDAAIRDARGNIAKPIFNSRGNHIGDESCRTAREVRGVLKPRSHNAVYLTDDVEEIKLRIHRI